MTVSKPGDDPGDSNLMLNAALDGELDAAGMMDIERRLAVDPALAAEYACLAALREGIRARAPREPAPERLRARIAAVAGLADDATDRASGRARIRNIGGLSHWRSLAASIAAAVILFGGAYAILLRPGQSEDVTRVVVAGYMRAQLSGRSVDIASSDRHTVKPWLAEKAPLGTTAVNLDAAGFSLVGGRIDIVRTAAVPTLVYKRGEHFVSVTELPSSASDYPNSPRRQSVEGYSVVVWADRARSYAAVSDIAAPELDAFAAAFRDAVAKEREDVGSPANTR